MLGSRCVSAVILLPYELPLQGTPALLSFLLLAHCGARTHSREPEWLFEGCFKLHTSSILIADKIILQEGATLL